jgi:hypothetical protein
MRPFRRRGEIVPKSVRVAATVWITESRKDPVLGSVYDQLPPYWSDEVALCG